MVDCHVVRGLPEKDKRKLILSGNKLFQLGSDDFDVINELLQSIADEGGFNVAGFSSDVLESPVKGAEDTQRVLERRSCVHNKLLFT